MILLVASLLMSVAEASIDCYTCSSRNGTDPYCEDPMSPAFLKLEKNCMVPKEGHIGKFPANFCVKMIGTSLIDGEHLVIRTCVLEDMNSQCGYFIFEDDRMDGCVLTCDYDGCNAAPPGFGRQGWPPLILLALLARSLGPSPGSGIPALHLRRGPSPPADGMVAI